MVTVTGVEVTRDLRTAKVFVSILGDGDREKTFEGLGSLAGHLRARIGKQLGLRSAPAPDPGAIDPAISRLTGEIDQQPPDFSAKLSGGVRAYDAARKGAPLALEPARVIVHRWTIL